jgi:beta-lactamase superfamily II metal-dependent hydrolase
MRKVFSAILLVLLAASLVFGQDNGKLQLHFIYVGQGDAAILISPLGETVLFDNGVCRHCDRPIAYLQELGIKQIDYHICSHYHDDHIGCTREVLSAFPLNRVAYDRGFSDQPANRDSSGRLTAFGKYLESVGAKRKQASLNEGITLDEETANPVTIDFVAMNGAGVEAASSENDLSLVAVISFGKFHAVMGGDLSGKTANKYKDIESTVAKQMLPLEVYKVHHHCSKYSSNKTWLDAITPKVAIISASSKFYCKTSYGHPTADCLKRLHEAKVKTYWTEKSGPVRPDPEWDVIAGNIKIEVKPRAEEFDVIHSNGSQVDTYQMWRSD